MTDPPAAPEPVDESIRHWEASGAAERANYSLFLTELCDLLSVTRPYPTDHKERTSFLRSFAGSRNVRLTRQPFMWAG
jgi:hypothetical protein